MAPQPSPVVPQASPCVAQDTPVHVLKSPHWYGVPPPPHVSDPVQVPQVIVPPQPSPMTPQVALTDAQVRLVHPAGMQVPEQQSVAAEHDVPVPWQDAQVPLRHIPQHWLSVVQVEPADGHI
jgi:hypothetical protein